MPVYLSPPLINLDVSVLTFLDEVCFLFANMVPNEVDGPGSLQTEYIWVSE